MKNIKKIFLSCLSVVATLLLIELSFRFYGYVKNIDFNVYLNDLTSSNRLPPEIFDDQKKQYVLLKPNVQALATTSDFSVIYKANNIGIRDKNYQLNKDQNKTRVVLLGDSFTFGEGVPEEKRFSDVLEKNLENLEVINFGMPGYGLDTIVILYEQVAKNYQPDFVMVAINFLDTQRNFSDIYHNGQVDLSQAKILGTSVDNGTALLKKEDLNIKKKIPFSSISYASSYLNYQIIKYSIFNKMEETDKKLWSNLRLYLDKKPTTEEEIYTNEKTISLLKFLKEKVENNGAKLIVINIDPEYSLDFIGEIIGKENYFNYQQKLDSYSKTNSLRFKYDFHFNSETNQTIGEWLTTDFKELLADKYQYHF
ncbi:MAG: SGNH/GDSL hydrolase family protein [Candidatus Pacebacteria bacterium]|nr:SGNH/GDSL hydrolase family protein [Candidatus Paceibacterota bacterium]